MLTNLKHVFFSFAPICSEFEVESVFPNFSKICLLLKIICGWFFQKFARGVEILINKISSDMRELEKSIWTSKFYILS